MQRRVAAHQSQAAHKDHQERQKRLAERKQKAQRRNKIIGASACLLVLIVAASWVVYTLTPGPYDNFAKCLTEKGMTMYGEDWCEFTNAQKAMFGKSFKYVTYEVKSSLNMRPTWQDASGEQYETVQSFERLAAVTGCEI